MRYVINVYNQLDLTNYTYSNEKLRIQMARMYSVMTDKLQSMYFVCLVIQDTENIVDGVFMCIPTTHTLNTKSIEWNVYYYGIKQQTTDEVVFRNSITSHISARFNQISSEDIGEVIQRRLPFQEESNMILGDKLLQITFLQPKIAQIGNMNNGVYVQNFNDMTEERSNEYTTFLTQHCGFDIDFKHTSSVNLIFFSLNDKGQITGLQYIIYDDKMGIAERYASCTATQYRRQGIMKKIDMTALEYMKLKFYNLKYVWTGIKMTANIDSVKKESERKIRSGFGWDLRIDKTTPLNNRSAFRFLSFYWKPNKRVTSSQIEISIRSMSDLIDEFHRTLYIPFDVVRQLKAIRDNNPLQEYGGHFTRNVESGEIENWQVEPLSTNAEFNVNGQNITCNVPVTINSAFSYHTHPEGCYQAFRHVLGWPSHSDLKSVMHLLLMNIEDITSIHFVLSRDGIYSVRLSKDIVNYYRTQGRQTLIHIASNQNTHSDIDHIIRRLNNIKTEIQDEAEANLLITQALNVMNGYNFVIEAGIEIPLFKVTFKRYNDIKTDIRFTRY